MLADDVSLFHFSEAAPDDDEKESWYPQSENANQIFAISNCFQNLAAGEPNWTITLCTGRLI